MGQFLELQPYASEIGLEILRKIIYYLRCDETGHTHFCFSVPDMELNLNFTGNKWYNTL
jgi:hypothetical protein